MILDEKTKEEFESAARPLIKFLAEKFHPHVSVIVTGNMAELVEGVSNFITDEYIVD